MAGACSSQKRVNGIVKSGDARPLFPVTTVNTKTANVRVLEGHWFIRSVNGKVLSGYEDDNWPFIEFVPSEGRFYGHNGCNVLNGSYFVDNGQKLHFSNVATSMRLCEGDSLSAIIAYSLDNTTGYSTSKLPDGAAMLNLVDKRNHVLMTLRKSDIDFINGPWKVTAIEGVPCKAANACLIFDVNTNSVSGNAGCNRLRGELTRELNTAGSLGFSNLATTRMSCPDIETESALLVALEEVTAARQRGKNVELMAPGDRVMVTLSPLTKADLQNMEQ